jgi:hypothetical protein
MRELYGEYYSKQEEILEYFTAFQEILYDLHLYI